MSFLTTAVTALRFISIETKPSSTSFTFLFAGIGNHLLVYNSGQWQVPIFSKPIVTSNVTIHGFSDSSSTNLVAVRSAHLVTVLRPTLNDDGSLSGIDIVARHSFDDWVWALFWVDPKFDILVVAGGHSKTWIAPAECLTASVRIDSQQSELTWSATFFIDETSQTLYATSGSSFGDIDVWRVLDLTQIESLLTQHGGRPFMDPSPRKPHRLHAHDGPVMRIVVSSDTLRMASVSVDRSVRVWKVSQPETCSSCPPHGCFVPVLSHYGHLARIWDVDFVCGNSLTVASVGEDRSCRLWSQDEESRQHAVYRDHAGRNVWTVAVAGAANNGSVVLATGGEDGTIKTRLWSPQHKTQDSFLEQDDANIEVNGTASSTQSIINPVSSCSSLFSLPGNLPNPRKAGGAKNESGRTILMTSANSLLVSTDFGRILSASWLPDKEQTQREDPQSDLDVVWTTLFHNPVGTAFTPCSLVLLNDNVVCAGQTDGCVTVIVTECKNSANIPTTRSVTQFTALDRGEGMVMGVFGIPSKNEMPHDVFVASGDGTLLHWHVHVIDDMENGTEGVFPVHCVQVGKYLPYRRTKTTLITSVTMIREKQLVIVGDKGGRIHVFRAPSQARHSSVHGDSTPPAAGSHAVAWLRVHNDRVSCLKNVDISRVLTTGFDGRVARLLVQGGENGSDVRVQLEREDRTAERVDTIVAVASLFSSTRSIIAGFRGAMLTVWDMERRSELFRHDVGNWRRAHDVWLVGGEVCVAFWRAGLLHVVRRQREVGGEGEGVDTEVGFGNGCEVGCGGIPFHGGRGNDVAWIDERHVITGGEDTTVRVTATIDGDERVGSSQQLHGHISCVNGVCARGDRGVAASCGGSDEVVIWEGTEGGEWRLGVRVTIGKVLEGRVGERHSGDEGRDALMRVTGIDGGFECGECSVFCGMWVVSRSDGSVVLLHGWKKEDGDGRWEMTGRLLGRHEDGAALSVCCDEMGAKFVSGGSGGTICVWGRDGGLMEEWKEAHDGGVDCVAVRRKDGDRGGGVMVVSGGDDERVCLWEVGGAGRWKSSVGEGHHAAVTGVAMVRGRTELFVSVGADRLVCLWDLSGVDGGDWETVGLVWTDVCAVGDVAAVCAYLEVDATDKSGSVDDGGYTMDEEGRSRTLAQGRTDGTDCEREEEGRLGKAVHKHHGDMGDDNCESGQRQRVQRRRSSGGRLPSDEAEAIRCDVDGAANVVAAVCGYGLQLLRAPVCANGTGGGTRSSTNVHRTGDAQYEA